MSRVCGCCDPPVGLAPLTLENRPALSALEYRIGTYGTFRETLLHQLSTSAGLPGLTTRADDDFAVTVIDLWSTVADVLTFYQERYANEAFLRTARERISVARLARLTGYALTPGVAATTQLVFAVDPAAGSLSIPARVRVKSVPAEGETAQTYETLEPLKADATLNSLRILPPPEPANPLARGATEALVAPGAGARRAAELAPGDRLLVFDGEHKEVEQLEVAEVRVEGERTTLVWTSPIQGWNWNASSMVAQVRGSFGLFGRSAPETYMTPRQSGSTVAWDLKTRAAAEWQTTQDGLSFELDGDVALKTGSRLLLTGAGTDPPQLLTVNTAAAARAEFAPLAGPATKVSVAQLLPALDRRTVVVHELVGEPLQFWGYTYPGTLSGATVYVPGRRIDSTTFEISGGGGRIQLEELELGRAVMLSDARQPGVPATIAAVSVTAPGPAPAAAAQPQLAALGLDLSQATAVLTSSLIYNEKVAAELEVTIGRVGPRTVVLTGSAPLARELEQQLKAADGSREFKRARVLEVESRRGTFSASTIVVVPGVDGARVTFAGTTADPDAASRLGLDEDEAAPALLVPRVRPVSGGPGSSQAHGGAGAPPDYVLGFMGSATAQMETLLRALPGRAFAAARVLAAQMGRMLLISGLTQAESQDYLRLDLRVPAGTVLDARTATLAGNVVRSSHGETVRDETVGSGDASVPFQRLSLKKKPLTYVPTGAGVIGTLELLVDGVRWRELPTLFAAGPGDRAYVVEEGDDGQAVLRFGDGRSGARLPSGTGNVHARYRVGSGLAGRVRAASLTAPLDRPRGLAGVSNPLSADGGADPESADAARTNAPQTVRTFGRAVSLRDFEDLARSSGEVAKAQAIWAWDGLARAVHLTLAQAGGGSFSLDGLRRLAGALDAARDPNHPLHLANATAVYVLVRARIGVASDRLQADVVAAARTALATALGFDAVRLGEPVFLSDVFRVLQDVEGVEWVDVDELGFKRPPDVLPTDWTAELRRRGVERTASGDVAPVQSRLRIFPARPDPERRGRVLPAELAQIEAPTNDLLLQAEGGLAA